MSKNDVFDLISVMLMGLGLGVAAVLLLYVTTKAITIQESDLHYTYVSFKNCVPNQIIYFNGRPTGTLDKNGRGGDEIYWKKEDLPAHYSTIYTFGKEIGIVFKKGMDRREVFDCEEISRAPGGWRIYSE